MKTIIVLGLCVVAAMGFSVPQAMKDRNKIREDVISDEDLKRRAPAVDYKEEHSDDGEYSIHYTTAEGTEVFEKGWFVPNANGTDKVLIVEGFYSYMGKDGKRYTTKYRSDIPGGFQAEGEHLPKSPEPENLAN